jgi:hypothetical protein
MYYGILSENYAATIASEGDAERAAELLKELLSQYFVSEVYP